MLLCFGFIPAGSVMTLQKRLPRAVVDDGVRPGPIMASSVDFREAQKTNPTSGAGSRGLSAGGGVSVAGSSAGKIFSSRASSPEKGSLSQ